MITYESSRQPTWAGFKETHGVEIRWTWHYLTLRTLNKRLKPTMVHKHLVHAHKLLLKLAKNTHALLRATEYLSSSGGHINRIIVAFAQMTARCAQNLEKCQFLQMTEYLIGSTRPLPLRNFQLSTTPWKTESGSKALCLLWSRCIYVKALAQPH